MMGRGEPVAVMTMSAAASALAQVAPGDGAAAHFSGQRFGVGRGAAGDRDLADALRPQVLRRQRADLAGADHQHAAAVEAAENLARQRHRGKAHRDRPFAERGLRAHALADAERRVKEAGEHRADALARGRHLERVLDLAEDLRFADHQRVEAGGHTEQVPRGVLVGPHEDVRLERLGGQPVVAVEELDQLTACARRVVAGDVDLRAVAGGQHHRLAGGVARRHAPPPPRRRRGSRNRAARERRWARSGGLRPAGIRASNGRPEGAKKRTGCHLTETCGSSPRSSRWAGS